LSIFSHSLKKIGKEGILDEKYMNIIGNCTLVLKMNECRNTIELIVKEPPI